MALSIRHRCFLEDELLKAFNVDVPWGQKHIVLAVGTKSEDEDHRWGTIYIVRVRDAYREGEHLACSLMVSDAEVFKQDTEAQVRTLLGAKVKIARMSAIEEFEEHTSIKE